MPAPIITAASTNAATAHTKRTKKLLWAHGGSSRAVDSTFQTSERDLSVAREAPIPALEGTCAYPDLTGIRILAGTVRRHREGAQSIPRRVRGDTRRRSGPGADRQH